MTFAGVSEKACRPGQDRLIRLTKYRATVRTDGLIQNVNANLARNDLTFTQRRKLLVAGSILSCARRRLGTLRFVCANSDYSFAARTYPLISNNVYLADNYFQDIPIRQKQLFFTRRLITVGPTMLSISSREDRLWTGISSAGRPSQTLIPIGPRTDSAFQGTAGSSIEGPCKFSPLPRDLVPRTESICKTLRVSLFMIQTLRFI